jgi:aspartate/methionine/tyrosine aminotransferase
MFSSRFTSWNLHPNRISRAVQERRRSGREILDLTGTNPTLAGLEPGDRLPGPAPFSPVYRPEPRGLRPAREAVAATYRHQGIDVDPDRIILTASTSEAYSWLFKLLADPGDPVLVPSPSYPLFDFLAGMEVVGLVSYDLLYDGGWRIDMPVLLRKLEQKPRALVLVNPNNPTGSYVKPEEWAAIAAACGEYNIPVISDEVFLPYTLEDQAEQPGSLAATGGCLVICLGGLSKAAGLPQMKLGWMVVAGPTELCERSMTRLDLVADTYLSVGTPVQEQAAALLQYGGTRRAMIHARVRENYRTLRRIAAEEPAVTVLQAEGGWSAIIRVPETLGEEEQVLQLVHRDGVLVQPGFFYDMPQGVHLVISLLTDPAVFSLGLHRLIGSCSGQA